MLGGAPPESGAKTSGSKRLQLYVPLNSNAKYDQTKQLSHELAIELERQHPEQVVSKMAKVLRKGKVFIDWSQNDQHKTTVCVYSLRAMTRPTGSTPLNWREVEASTRSKVPLAFTAQQVIARIDKQGDLFKPVLSLKQKLPAFS